MMPDELAEAERRMRAWRGGGWDGKFPGQER